VPDSTTVPAHDAVDDRSPIPWCIPSTYDDTNGSKIRNAISAGTPGPVAANSMRTFAPSEVVVTLREPPSSAIASRAFRSKFSSACSSCGSSASITGGSPRFVTSSMLASYSSCRTTASTRRTTTSTLTFRRCAGCGRANTSKSRATWLARSASCSIVSNAVPPRTAASGCSARALPRPRSPRAAASFARSGCRCTCEGHRALARDHNGRVPLRWPVDRAAPYPARGRRGQKSRR
jgi:hypothetical protein